MNFTKEDILKIQLALALLGVKDSEFLDATLPLSKTDRIALLQEGKNKKITIGDFNNQMLSLFKSDFINLTEKYSIEYVPLEEAVSSIPSSLWREGLVITFYNNEKLWKIYQFIGNINQFTNPTLWKDLFDVSLYVINSYLPDEEDITASLPDDSGNSKLSLKDKLYDPTNFSGMGTKIIRKNIIEITLEDGTIKRINYLSPDIFNSENTIYVIKYDFTLAEDITIPANCMLEFDGGSIFGEHTITGINTGINAGFIKIFNTDIILAGSWNVTEAYPEWFGAKNDGVTDSTNAIIAALNFIKPTGGVIKLLQGVYLTAPIDLTGFKNICITGFNDADSRPWIAQTTIKIIKSGEVGIRLVPEYDKAHDAVPVITDCCGYSKIKNIYLDCNHNTNKGINANWNIIIENFEIRHSNGDGIVIEAYSYPVTLNHVHSNENGGHGLSVLGPNTTSIFINDLDCSHNSLYGMYMEAGNGCLFNNVFLQYNDVGGLKIIKKDTTSSYPYYFGYVDFTNLYTEDNGKLLDSDAKFEGNCAVLIQGNNLSPTDYKGKVENLRFYNCIFNKSLVKIGGVPVNSVGFKCEGASDILLSGCNISNIDETKNIPAAMSQRISSGISFAYNKPYLNDYQIYKNTQNIFKLLVGNTSTEFNVSSCYVLGSKIGNQVNISVKVSIPETTIDNNNNYVHFKLVGLHVESYTGIYTVNHIVGTAEFGGTKYPIYVSGNELFTDFKINDIKVGGLMYITINTLFFKDE